MNANRHLIAVVFFLSLFKPIFGQGLDYIISEERNKDLCDTAKKYKIQTRKLSIVSPFEDSINNEVKRIEYYDKEGRRDKTEYYHSVDSIEVEMMKFDAKSQMLERKVYFLKGQSSKDSIITYKYMAVYKDTFKLSEEVIYYSEKGKIEGKEVTHYNYNFGLLSNKESISYSERGKQMDKNVVKYFYDENAALILEMEVKMKNDTTKTAYEYNKKGQITTKILAYRDSMSSYYKPFGYDKFGNPVKGDSFDIVELKTIYTYDNNGNLVHQELLANNLLKDEDIYTFNSKNLLVEEVHKKDNFTYDAASYEYDSNNKLIRMIGNFPNSINPITHGYDEVRSTNIIYEYNSMGLKIKEKTLAGRRPIPDLEIKYTFY